MIFTGTELLKEIGNVNYIPSAQTLKAYRDFKPSESKACRKDKNFWQRGSMERLYKGFEYMQYCFHPQNHSKSKSKSTARYFTNPGFFENS